MSTDHSAHDSIPYSALEPVLPLASLPTAAVVRGAAAAALVRAADADETVTVAPVSTATGYRLAQMRPAVVRLEDLPDATVGRLAARAETTLSGVRFVVLGRVDRERDHALAEFA